MRREEWPGVLRMLTYTLTMSRDVMSDLDFCVRSIENDDDPLEDYLDAVRSALACGEPIGPIMGLSQHSEATLHAFLVGAEQRIAAKIAARGARA